MRLDSSAFRPQNLILGQAASEIIAGQQLNDTVALDFVGYTAWAFCEVEPMTPAIERTITTGIEVETVPRETQALLLTPPEGTPTTPADVDVLADARASSPQLGAQHQARPRRGLEGFHQLVP